MAFTKGQSGNPTGRKKGTPNKATKDIKEIISSIVTRHLSEAKIAKDLKELSPKQRLDYLVRLAEFIIPKPKSIEPENPIPLTMQEKYSRVTDYIRQHLSRNQDDKEGNHPFRSGGLVTIIQEKNLNDND
jgi:hypothetical protein